MVLGEGNKYTIEYFAYRGNVPVMDNLMCQFGWDTAPRYLVRYYFGYFFEDSLWIK